MRTKDWARMRRRLEAVNKNRRELSAAAWTSLGVMITSAFAALSWWPTYAALSAEQKAEFAWIWPAIIAAGSGGLILAGLLFWGAHLLRDQQKVTIDSIIEDMDEIHDVRSLLEAV